MRAAGGKSCSLGIKVFLKVGSRLDENVTRGPLRGSLDDPILTFQTLKFGKRSFFALLYTNSREVKI